MAVTGSVGYAGDVDEIDWATYGGRMGAQYSVVGPGDLRPVISTTLARGVRVQAGTAVGCGVIDTCTWTDVQLPVVSGSGNSRWFLIVLKRKWGATKASTIEFIPTGVTDDTTLPARAIGPGVEDDQPLALALVVNGQTQVQTLRDLRCWSTNGGMVALHTLALQYLTDPGTRCQIDTKMYTRIMSGTTTAAWHTADFTNFNDFPWSRIADPTSIGSLGSSAEGWTSADMGSEALVRGDDIELDLRLRRGAGRSDDVDTNGVFTDERKVFTLSSTIAPRNTIVAHGVYRIGSGDYLGCTLTINPDGTVALRNGVRNNPLVGHASVVCLIVTARYTR